MEAKNLTSTSGVFTFYFNKEYLKFRIELRWSLVFLGFQEPVTPIMEGLVDLHNFIMFYLVLIVCFCCFRFVLDLLFFCF